MGRFHFVAALLLAACFPPTVTVTPLGSGQTYPATPDSVEIALFTTGPECAYSEIASLTAEGQANWVSDQAITDTLKARARSIGAEAVINFTQGNRNVTPGGGKLPGDYRTRGGTAIRFKDPTCRR